MNGEKTVAKTIESVLMQSYEDIEYLILDGGSTDASIRIAESYRERFREKGISYTIHSEPDQGMYNALNKGIRIARGELVGNINADDWYEPDALRIMAEAFEREPYDIAWGNILVHGKHICFVKKARIGRIWTTMHFCHPAMFARREVLLEIPYAEISATDDFDMILRSHKAGKKIRTVDRLISNYHLGGMSFNSDIRPLGKCIREKYAHYQRNGFSRWYFLYCVLIETVKHIVILLERSKPEPQAISKDSRKIFQINSHYNFGGVARIAALLHQRMRQSGYYAVFLYGRGKKQDIPGLLRFETWPEILASAFFSRLSGLHGFGNRIATARLIKRIRKEKPDLIHIHALHGYYLHTGMFFSFLEKAKIPVLWTFHDCYAFTGKCGYFFDCSRWKSGCGNCPYLHRYPSSLFVDATRYMWKKKKDCFCRANLKKIVVPSEWMKMQVEQSFLKEIPCRMIHNGIDTGIYYPRSRAKCRRKYGYGDKDKILLAVAMDFSDSRKGLRYLLQAAHLLQKRKEIRILLVGVGSAVKKKIRMENIRCLPRILDEERMAEYYSMADAFLLPSIAENYATTALEAMACGTPVVGFDTGGTRELIPQGCGEVVPPRDTAAFVKAICRTVYGNGCLSRERIADIAGREHSVEHMWQEYREVYEEILSQEGKERK